MPLAIHSFALESAYIVSCHLLGPCVFDISLFMGIVNGMFESRNEGAVVFLQPETKQQCYLRGEKPLRDKN